MKKILYICLALIILSGIGVGSWFMFGSPGKSSETADISESDKADYSTKTVSEVFQQLESTKHLAVYYATTPALTQTETGTNVIFFAPNKTAVDTFTKDTALGLEKFLPYHVVVSSELPVNVIDGAKLKTVDGQELLVVTANGDLYLRDAKGNDVRLRKPIDAKNGKIYVIDKVLLTQ